MGSQKKEAILQAKWAANFVKKAKNEDVLAEINWWKSHTMELPKWAKTGMLQLTLQLSSRNLRKTTCHLWKTTWNFVMLQYNLAH